MVIAPSISYGGHRGLGLQLRSEMAGAIRVAVLGATLAVSAAFTCTPGVSTLRLAAAVHELRPSGVQGAASNLAAPRLRGASIRMMAEKLDKRAERRRIVSSDLFNRRGFKDTKEEVEGMMVEEFTSDMIKELKENNNELVREKVQAPPQKDGRDNPWRTYFRCQGCPFL